MNLSSLPGYTASKITFDLMAVQSASGFCFHRERAEDLREHVEREMEIIREGIEPKLPPRPLLKSEEFNYTVPAKPFKQDGTLSVIMVKWLEKHGLELIGVNHIKWEGELVKIVGGTLLPATAPMTLSNQAHIKDFFIAEGWKPTLWNLKTDARGRPERDKRGKVIPTSPKMQENGRLCPNLEEMNGELAAQVVRYLSLSNRLGIIKGWLANERLDVDGKLCAAASGIANTHRQRHTVVVNTPKADPTVLLGAEMRDLLVAPEGYVLVGFDASALEANVEAHYCLPYPGGDAYVKELIQGDIHMKTCSEVFAKHVGHLIGTDRWHKDDVEVKPWRSKAKGIKYSTTYGAQAGKVADLLNISKEDAQEVLDNFWASAEPLKLFKEKLVEFWSRTGGKRWVLGIDGRRLYSRSEHSLVNLVFQSCGATIMDYSGIFLAKWLGGVKRERGEVPYFSVSGYKVYRCVYNHDEYVYACPPELADMIAELGCKSISQAAKHLKIRVPISGEAKIGNSWKEIH